MQLMFSGAIPAEDGATSAVGILGILDLESGRVIHRCEYVTPDARRAPDQKMQITGFSFSHGSLFACTHNEVLVYDEWPPAIPVDTFSDPGFNDLHHCLPHAGGLAVANTGLETVDLLDFNGRLEHRWDLLEGIEGARKIRDDVDYRLLPDTKPHLRHANHLFEVDGKLWTSQLRTKNAICIDEPDKTFEMQVGNSHDGDWVGDRVVFTTTNGHLVYADPRTGERAIHDLTEMTPGFNQLGWCRGFAADPRDENRVFVSFTKFRRSRWREFGYWVKHLHQLLPGRICEYDLKEGRIVQTYDLDLPDPGYTLFQLHFLPDSMWV